jgi:ABC-type multidrug transport system fused ATPase/permease subunit
MASAILPAVIAVLVVIGSLFAAIILGVIGNLVSGLISENSEIVARCIVEVGLRFVSEEDRGTERSIIHSDLANLGGKPWTGIIHAALFATGTITTSTRHHITTLSRNLAARIRTINVGYNRMLASRLSNALASLTILAYFTTITFIGFAVIIFAVVVIILVVVQGSRKTLDDYRDRKELRG